MSKGSSYFVLLLIQQQSLLLLLWGTQEGETCYHTDVTHHVDEARVKVTFNQNPSSRIPRWWYPVGTVASFACTDFFSVLKGGPEVIKCTADGYWSDIPPPTCETSCSAYDRFLFPNDKVVVVRLPVHRPSATGRYPANTRVTFNCNGSHYLLVGNSETFCNSATGRWTGNQPKCVATCKQLEPFSKKQNELGFYFYNQPKADFSPSIDSDVRYTVNTVATWRCNSSLYAVVGNAEFVCQENGKWTYYSNKDIGDQQQQPRCVPTCAPPLFFDDQSIIATDFNIPPDLILKSAWGDLYPVNTTVSFRCKEEHEEFVGINQSVCLANGTWSPYGTLKCARTCGPMPSSDGAMTNTEDAIPIFHPSSFDKPAGRYSIGTKVTFDCADYNLVRLNGSRVLECLPEGQWNGTRPSCDVVLMGSTKGLGTQEYALIWTCSALAFVLLLVIAIFFRTRQKRRSHSGHSSGTGEEKLDSFPIYESLDPDPSSFTRGNGKIYENILPVLVNKEPIYTEVETGIRRSSRSIHRLISDDEEPVYSNIDSAGSSIAPASSADSSSSNYAEIVTKPTSKSTTNRVEPVYAQVDKTKKVTSKIV